MPRHDRMLTLSLNLTLPPTLNLTKTLTLGELHFRDSIEVDVGSADNRPSDDEYEPDGTLSGPRMNPLQDRAAAGSTTMTSGSSGGDIEMSAIGAAAAATSTTTGTTTVATAR